MRRLWLVPIVVVVVAGACGGSPTPLVAPPIPTAAVPARVDAAGGLVMQPNASKDVQHAFRSVGPTSLVKEGRVWEVRQGERLVGLLELASIGRRADTRKEADRQAMRRQILVGEPAELDFSGVPVYETTDGALSTFVWFGRQMLGTLTLKGVDADAVSNDLVTRILQDRHWPNLSPDAFQQN